MRMALVITAAGLAACATPGSRPGDMSAAGHEQRAAQEERIGSALGPGKDVEQMRFRQKVAEDHRRAARTLREAEDKACAGLAEEERTIEPFAPSRIVAVAPIDGATSQRGAGPSSRGALVRLYPADQETVEGLKRRIECAQARHAALGSERPEARESPFAVPGVTVDVRATPDGSIVEFRTSDRERAEAVVYRLRRYASRR